MDHIGRYRTEHVLGTGAFATVWLAHDESLDAQVAIKVLAENWARDEAIRRRFTDEARILWRADSDHLVRVHTVDELPDGRPYFVMDYADRGTLADRMQARFQAGQWFSVPEALAISRDIAEGLGVVHALGIAHRDLKPANVMYRSLPEHAAASADERLVLVDFGIAKNLAGAGATTIATGTPHYMAPEQAEGRADRRSDVYSAAVVLYELLARRVPYPYDSVGELLRAQAAGSFTPLEGIRGDVPAELAATIARALDTDPDGRFADAGAWLAALSGDGTATPPPVDSGATMAPDEMRARGVSPAAVSAGGVSGPPPPSGPPPGPPTPTPPPERRRRRALVLPLVLLFLLLAGAIGAIVATRSTTADGPNAREAFAEPIASLGRHAFTAPVTPNVEALRSAHQQLAGLEAKVRELPALRLPQLDLSALRRGTQGVPAVSGSAPGLYGGTNLVSVCDAKQLVAFLTAHADKARAWASVLGIRVDAIPSYVASLTDVILRADTRVTNHGFAQGRPTYLNSILQAGTAVLIDRFGLPVVRCKCGNPLTAARPLASNPRVAGDPWPGFSLQQTVVVAPSPQPISTFALANVLTGEPLRRPAGSSTPTSTSTTTSTTATTAPAAPVDITRQGAVSASSSTPGYGSSLAVDGNESTSWFSLGSNVDGDTSTFRWSAPSDVHITRVDIDGNAQNARPDFRNKFGYNSVTVQVLTADGSVVFTRDVDLPGTPDPNISVAPDMVGRTIVLLLHGHEAPDCGGFAELRVFAA